MDFNPESAYDLLDGSLGPCIPFLSSDTSVREARAWSMRQSIFKKWIPKDTAPLESVAIMSFIESNRHCEGVSFDTTSYYYDILQMAQALMHEYINSGPFQTNVLTLFDFLNNGAAGPGSSVGTKHTDFYQKMFRGRLSTTSAGLHRFYLANISQRWVAAELFRLNSFGLDIVGGSKLSTVPKSSKTNRTICTEPSLNMFFQLGAGTCIEQLLRRFHNIELSLQPDRNREYARLGSINGSYATIDLKSASDTISTRLVKYLLPESAFASLDLIRSKKTMYHGHEIDLTMFSSMGNGFTFPLQTMIFATLVRAYYLCNGIPLVKDGKPTYSVFGDDIICLSQAYDGIVNLLEYVGFWVNREKSFNSGSFRESCGSDFFKGHNIRGVYLKEINNESQAYSAFNRLARWSVDNNFDISCLLRYVARLVDFRPIPFHDGDAEGIKCPSSLLTNLRKDANGARFYRALVGVPRKIRVGSGIDDNYHGALISAIGGYIENNNIGLRVNRPCYQVVKRKSPCWDYLPNAGTYPRDYEDCIRASFSQLA
jgi:hypothetical protein